MNSQALKQRIAYLVEHGGIAEDPLTEIRRDQRILAWVAGSALVLVVIDLLVSLLLPHGVL